jgi:transcription elongation GreA/GreB family factor
MPHQVDEPPRVENAPDCTHILAMSRPFGNEDDFVEDLPDRPIPEHPNLVTANGLALIEAAFETARRAYGEAQAAGDRAALASAGRDLRYWSARRASAQLVSIDPDNDAVQF